MRSSGGSGGSGLSGLCRVTDHLYLSSRRSALDSSQVSLCRITCIVNVSESRSRCAPPAGVEDYLHLPVPDSPLSPIWIHFDPVSDLVQRTAERGGRTLLHCEAGRSRSATLCAAYLMKYRDLTLLEAHTWIKTCRPTVRPNPGFWRQLIRYEAELRGSNSVRMMSSPLGEIPDIYEDETRDMVPL
ncbi:dual specificity protein phosphatase 18-like [Xyrichtys novacula]|uniref:Dual specificity protein phosphatase 18-like n=1 Tax=Xyrichtys novacula TaxID=13765 RepID=A0AAV1G5E0_XYRNO|nr:dual specificity protein phosphatase 18-like [Xyrichtys novacula]